MSLNTSPQDTMLLGTANSDGTFTGVTSGTSVALPPSPHDSYLIAVIGNGTISGGTLLIEEAFWTDRQMPYSGTWSQVYSVTASGVSGGAQQHIHIAPNANAYRRVRISSNITGGGGLSVAARKQ